MALSPARKKIIIIAVILGILVLVGGITGVIILQNIAKPPSPDQKDTDDDDDDDDDDSSDQQKCPNNSYTYEDSNGNCIECPSNQYVGPNKTCVYCDSGYEYSRSEDSCMLCDPSKGQFYDEDSYSCGTYCETGVECNTGEVCRDGFEKVINNEYQIPMCCKEGETPLYNDEKKTYFCGTECQNAVSCSADGICVNDDHTNTQITSLDSVTNYACCPNKDSDGNSITPAWTGTECCKKEETPLYYDEDEKTFKCCSQADGIVFNNKDFTDADGNTVNYPTTCCSIDNAEYVYDKNTGTTTYTGNCCSFGTASLDETEKKTFLDDFLGKTDYVLNNYDVQQCVQTTNCNTDLGINSENAAWNEQGAACTTVCGYENEDATVKNYCCDADANSCGDYCSFDDTDYSCVNSDDSGKTLCPKGNVYVKAVTIDEGNSFTSQGEYCCDTDNNTLTDYMTVDGKPQWTKCCSSDKVLDEGEYSKTCCQDNQYVLPDQNSPSTDVCCAKSNVIWKEYNNGSPSEKAENAKFCCVDNEIGISTDGDGNQQQECCSGGWLLLPDDSSTKTCANTNPTEVNGIKMACPSGHTTYINASSDELDSNAIGEIWEKIEDLYDGKKIYGPNSTDSSWNSNTTYGTIKDDGTSGLIEITGENKDFETYCVKNISDKQAIVMCLPENLSTCDSTGSAKIFPSVISNNGTPIYPYSKVIYQDSEEMLETDYIHQDTDSKSATIDGSMYWNGTDVARIEQTELPGCDNSVSGLISCLRKMSTTIDSQTNLKYTQMKDSDDNPYGLCTKISIPGATKSGEELPDNVQNLLNASTASDTDSLVYTYTAWDNNRFTINPCEDKNACIGDDGSWALTGPGSGMCIPHLDDDYNIGYYEEGTPMSSPDDGILLNINVLLVEDNKTTGPCPQTDLNSGRVDGAGILGEDAITYMSWNGPQVTSLGSDSMQVVIVENRTKYYLKYSYLKAEDSQKGGTSSDHVYITDGIAYRDDDIEKVEYGDTKTAKDSNGTLEWKELAVAKPWNIGSKGSPTNDSDYFVQGKYYEEVGGEKETKAKRWGDIKIYLRDSDDSDTPIYFNSLIVSDKTTKNLEAHGKTHYRISFRASGKSLSSLKPVEGWENSDSIVVYDKDKDDKVNNQDVGGLNKRFALFTLEEDDEDVTILDGGDHYYTAVVNGHIVIGKVIQLTLDQFKSYGVARSYWRLASIEANDGAGDDFPSDTNIKDTLRKYFPGTDVEAELYTSDETTGTSIFSAVQAAGEEDDSWAASAW